MGVQRGHRPTIPWLVTRLVDLGSTRSACSVEHAVAARLCCRPEGLDPWILMVFGLGISFFRIIFKQSGYFSMKHLVSIRNKHIFRDLAKKKTPPVLIVSHEVFSFPVLV